jgi:hypothetical protein
VFDHIDTLHVAGNEEIHPSVEKSAPTAGISLVVVGLLWSAVAATKYVLVSWLCWHTFRVLTCRALKDKEGRVLTAENPPLQCHQTMIPIQSLRHQVY